jgi:hypothetical protein
MDNFKCIKATAETMLRVQTSLCDIDCEMQGALKKIKATTALIKTLVSSPGVYPDNIEQLCDMIEGYSEIAMNTANFLAEDFGAHYEEDAEDRQSRH